jgi:NDP-mannose synthase
MKAIILAGGLGERLKPLTSLIPKPLLPIKEKSILELIINHLASFGCSEVIIATNYKSDLFEKYFSKNNIKGVNLIFSKESEPLGTAGPIKLAKERLNEPFIAMNGDLLTTLNIWEMMKTHSNSNAKLTMATKKVEMPLHYGVINSKDGIRVHSVEEKPSIKSEINAGIYLFEPEIVDEIPDGLFSMTDLIQKLLDKNIMVAKHHIDEYWLDIGQMSNYDQAKEDAKNGLF